MDKKFLESSLAELISDPLVGLVMKSDGVDRRSIEQLFERIGRERAGILSGAARCGGGRPCSAC